MVGVCGGAQLASSAHRLQCVGPRQMVYTLDWDRQGFVSQLFNLMRDRVEAASLEGEHLICPFMMSKNMDTGYRKSLTYHKKNLQTW